MKSSEMLFAFFQLKNKLSSISDGLDSISLFKKKSVRTVTGADTLLLSVLSELSTYN